jgi:hypothetical protein
VKEAMKNLNLDENLMKDIEEKIDNETTRVIESIPKNENNNITSIEEVLKISKSINEIEDKTLDKIGNNIIKRDITIRLNNIN